MPDRTKSTLLIPAPPITPGEADAQGVCRTARSMLETVKAFLEAVYLNLPDPRTRRTWARDVSRSL